MPIVDAQVHIWSVGPPTNPSHRQINSFSADELLKEGIYVIGFSFPVVPEGKARIRVQVSAAHEKMHLDKAMAAFAKVGKKMGVIH